MTFKDIQDEVDIWVSRYPEGYWKPLEIHARLSEEVGELARELNHTYGAKKKKETEPDNTIGAEIADIIFTLVCLSNREKINLQTEWDKLVKEKLYGRDNNRFEKVEKKDEIKE